MEAPLNGTPLYSIQPWSDLARVNLNIALLPGGGEGENHQRWKGGIKEVWVRGYVHEPTLRWQSAGAGVPVTWHLVTWVFPNTQVPNGERGKVTHSHLCL